MTAAKEAAAPSAGELSVDRVRDNLYVIRGGGRSVPVGGETLASAGNTAALVTERGVVLVDTKLPGWGRPILEKLEEITDRPVTTVINTHTHMDHVCGNVDLPPGVDIVAHENTARLMAQMRPVAGGPAQANVFREAGGRGLPTRTFRDRLTLGSGADRVELYHFGAGHTSGDAWVVFPAAGVVHAGDLFAHKAVPVLDVHNGASGIAYPRTIARALEGLTGIETVLTGHYPRTLAWSDLATYGRFLQEFVEAVQSARAAGRTVDDFLETWRMPERYLEEGYVSFEHLRPLRADVEVIWNERG